TLRMTIQSTEIKDEVKKNILGRLDETITEVRRISNNLMPSVLKDFGVGEAISNLVNQINQNGHIDVLYKNDMDPTKEIDDNLNTSLYRIAQESINNAIRHSGAKKIKVSLTQFDDHVSYYIADDG